MQTSDVMFLFMKDVVIEHSKRICKNQMTYIMFFMFFSQNATLINLPKHSRYHKAMPQ